MTAFVLFCLFNNCVCFRYASLYFCCAIEQEDNELLTLELIHRYVELLDKYFGSVSNRYLIEYLFQLFFQNNKQFFNFRFVNWILYLILKRHILF